MHSLCTQTAGGEGQRDGRVGSGWRWAKGDRVGTSVKVSTTKKVVKKSRCYALEKL